MRTDWSGELLALVWCTDRHRLATGVAALLAGGRAGLALDQEAAIAPGPVQLSATKTRANRRAFAGIGHSSRIGLATGVAALLAGGRAGLALDQEAAIAPRSVQLSATNTGARRRLEAKVILIPITHTAAVDARFGAYRLLIQTLRNSA